MGLRYPVSPYAILMNVVFCRMCYTFVSLQNIGLFCRSLLQKRPIFLSILLIVLSNVLYIRLIECALLPKVLFCRIEQAHVSNVLSCRMCHMFF